MSAGGIKCPKILVEVNLKCFIGMSVLNSEKVMEIFASMDTTPKSNNHHGHSANGGAATANNNMERHEDRSSRNSSSSGGEWLSQSYLRGEGF